jgi:L-aminopeptidase/D-esterase-like protein
MLKPATGAGFVAIAWSLPAGCGTRWNAFSDETTTGSMSAVSPVTNIGHGAPRKPSGRKKYKGA